MSLIADILLIAGALGAAFYCIVLSRRLSRLSNMETGMGGAISVLSAQVTDMTRTLERAQAAARTSSASLEDATARAEKAAQRLELLLASLHDLPDAPTAPKAAPKAAPKPAPAQAEDAAPRQGPAFMRSARARRRQEAAE